MKYNPTIGLEIHIELATNSKMFCDCKNDPNEIKANTNICPICMAHPGALPVINKEAVNKVIKTGLALNCKISKNTFFERKNYFYPDLPKGYQISQYVAPLCRDGYLAINDTKKIGIERVHLEEDTGRLIHPKNSEESLVDFNRAGVPLMELVTMPELNSAEEARQFAKELQLIVRYLGVSEANMEKAQMRVEVNISLALKSAKKLGVKVEIKNLNSIKSVEKAIEFEIKRQTDILNKGGEIIQETRGWHDMKQITFSQRSKEQAHDYRYFPEPDLPPLRLSDAMIMEIKSEIPELPADKMLRFQKQYNLNEEEARLFIAQKELGGYFEEVISELGDWIKTKMPEISLDSEEFKKMVKLASNYISTDLRYLLKDAKFDKDKFPITPENFAEFLSMIFTGEISSKIAKIVLKEMFDNGGDPSQIIKDRGLEQISGFEELDISAKQVIDENKEAVEEYKNGKQAALQFLIGKMMQKTKGKANPQQTAESLKKLLQ